MKGSDFISRLNGPILELDSLGSKHFASTIKELRSTLNSNEIIELKNYEKIYSDTKYRRFNKDSRDVLKTEQVYLMLSLLNEHWGPIKKVQKEVLELFHDILSVNGFRSLTMFSSNFKGISKGKVLPSNVPDVENNAELRRHVILPKMWLKHESRPEDKKDNFVEVEMLIE